MDSPDTPITFSRTMSAPVEGDMPDGTRTILELFRSMTGRTLTRATWLWQMSRVTPDADAPLTTAWTVKLEFADLATGDVRAVGIMIENVEHGIEVREIGEMP